MDAFKHAGQCKYVGIGGYKCYCCKPKSAEKQLMRRSARRRLKQSLNDNIIKECTVAQ